MNRKSNIHTTAVCATLLAAAALIGRAGSLDPPPGPIAPTHKTLTDIEPRIAVGPDTTPGNAGAVYHISEPGSYYLTGNVAGETGKHGITVGSPDVTLDLNGFTLLGVAGSLHGISTSSENVHIHDGVVRNWGGNGIEMAFGSGGSVTRVGAHRNGGYGIRMHTAGRIVDCQAVLNDLSGISAGNGNTVTGCTTRDNAEHGFTALSYAVFENCTAASNDQNGFELLTTIVGPAQGVILTACSGSNNSGLGFNGGERCVLTSCAASGNAGGGFAVGDGCALSQCVAVGNSTVATGAAGILTGAGSTITACTANQSGGAGIDAGNFSTISACTAKSNEGVGIHGGHSTITCSTSAGNSSGFVSGFKSAIVACLAKDNEFTGIDNLAGLVAHSASYDNDSGIFAGLAHGNSATGNTQFPQISASEFAHNDPPP